MCEAKWLFKVLVIGAILEGCHLISSRGDPNGTAEILWNLSNRAIQSRQYQYPAYQQPQSFMDALASVAYNDELHCVPKLLCELTSSSKPTQSILPFDINLESLSGVLSTLNAVSPILLFGRAALLGYTSGGNANLACSRAFPRCPNDPNQLVNYLNNYNGGFFRYFNGLPQRYRSSESRILSGSNPSIKFPKYSGYHSDDHGDRRSAKSLSFPGETREQPTHDLKAFIFPREGADYQRVRGGKGVNFDRVRVETSGLDFQRVRPNHIADPYIYPTRTGTGELLFDRDF